MKMNLDIKHAYLSKDDSDIGSHLRIINESVSGNMFINYFIEDLFSNNNFIKKLEDKIIDIISGIDIFSILNNKVNTIINNKIIESKVQLFKIIKGDLLSDDINKYDKLKNILQERTTIINNNITSVFNTKLDEINVNFNNLTNTINNFESKINLVNDNIVNKLKRYSTTYASYNNKSKKSYKNNNNNIRNINILDYNEDTLNISKSVARSDFTMYIDDNGYLVDDNGKLIYDDFGKKIFISKENIDYFKDQGIYKE